LTRRGASVTGQAPEVVPGLDVTVDSDWAWLIAA
jgi:hypothetical protein